MTPVQDTLFSTPITSGTHRRSDPASSVIAAKSVRPGRAHASILEAFIAAGGTGTLDSACDALPNMLRSSVSRRLSDLDVEHGGMGLIRKSDRFVQGRYGQPIVVWEVVR